jgi:hypothetical protein
MTLLPESRAARGHRHALRRARGGEGAEMIGDQMQGQVDAGGDAGAGPDLAVTYDDSIGNHPRAWREFLQQIQVQVVRGHTAAIEQARARRQQCARTHRHQTQALAPGAQGPQPPRDGPVLRIVGSPLAGVGPADQDDPRGRRKRCRQGVQPTDQRPDRALRACLRSDESKVQRRRVARPGKQDFLVRHSKGLGRPCPIEDQTAARQDKQDLNGSWHVRGNASVACYWPRCWLDTRIGGRAGRQ